MTEKLIDETWFMQVNVLCMNNKLLFNYQNRF